MATQKRHVVYLSDEEWGKAVAYAQAFDMTASAYIRSLIVGVSGSRAFEITMPVIHEPGEHSFTPVPKPARRK